MPPQPLITTEALSERLVAGSATPVLLDFRPAEVFAAGHIPGAVHLNLFGVSLIDTVPGPKPKAQSRRRVALERPEPIMDTLIDFVFIHTSRGRHVAALVTLLFAVGACASDPERLRAERTIEAEYDRETGRLELITFDSDDNGTVDTWSYMDGNRVLRIEIDRDEDGTIDRWEYYLEDQTLERVGFSRGNDGVVDAWAFEGEDGEVTRIEISTVGDEQVDRWEFYEEGVLVKAEEDVDLDTRPDKWETYADGHISSAAFDQTGNGRPDRRLVYADGALAAIESDPGEDGAYRTRIEVGR